VKGKGKVERDEKSIDDEGVGEEVESVSVQR
jgi:hypothetical protein